MPDDRFTDGEIAAMAAAFAALYEEAAKEAQAEILQWFERFADEDARKLEQVASGEIGKTDHASWRRRKMTSGKAYRRRLGKIAAIATDANEQAAEIINGRLPRIAAESANEAAFSICKALGLDAPFEVRAEDDAQGVFKGTSAKMPKQKVRHGKDLTYNRRRIAEAVQRGVQMGESVEHIAERVQDAVGANERQAMCWARTGANATENAAHQATYEQARDMGVSMQKEWLATLDMRTRNSHRELDGKRVGVDEPFVIRGHEIMFPGDPNAPWDETKNCRCRIIPIVDGVDEEGERWQRLPKGMTYEDWKKGNVAFQEVERPKRPARKKRISASKEYEAAMDRIATKEYRAMLSDAVGSDAADGVHSTISTIMRHRGGTNGEDIYAVDLSNGKTITSYLASRTASEAKPDGRFLSKVSNAVADGRSVAIVHNHPASGIPSAADMYGLASRNCDLGVIACHDGSVYTFRKVNKPLEGYNIGDQDDLDGLVALYRNKPESSLFDAIERNLGIRVEHFSTNAKQSSRTS